MLHKVPKKKVLQTCQHSWCLHSLCATHRHILAQAHPGQKKDRPLIPLCTTDTTCRCCLWVRSKFSKPLQCMATQPYGMFIRYCQGIGTGKNAMHTSIPMHINICCCVTCTQRIAQLKCRMREAHTSRQSFTIVLCAYIKNMYNTTGWSSMMVGTILRAVHLHMLPVYLHA